MNGFYIDSVESSELASCEVQIFFQPYFCTWTRLGPEDGVKWRPEIIVLSSGLEFGSYCCGFFFMFCNWLTVDAWSFRNSLFCSLDFCVMCCLLLSLAQHGGYVPDRLHVRQILIVQT